MTPLTPTVFIVDDDTSARRGLTRLVRVSGLAAESFASAGDFLAAGCSDRPGCMVLDVQMPEMTGPELQEALAEVDCGLPIIFLSAHGDVPTTAAVMKKGAVDFLTKPVDCDDLLTAIERAIATDSARRTEQAAVESIAARVATLTPREHEVMIHVITGMLNKQTAVALGISEETIKIHRGRVMHKLNVVSVAELVRLCEQAGIAPASADASRPPHA
jgi:FixJ family two-component response regulator